MKYTLPIKTTKTEIDTIENGIHKPTNKRRKKYALMETISFNISKRYIWQKNCDAIIVRWHKQAPKKVEQINPKTAISAKK